MSFNWPLRSLRWATEKVPKPVRVNFPSAVSDSWIAFRHPFRAFSEAALEKLACWAILAMRSALVMGKLLGQRLCFSSYISYSLSLNSPQKSRRMRVQKLLLHSPEVRNQKSEVRSQRSVKTNAYSFNFYRKRM